MKVSYILTLRKVFSEHKLWCNRKFHLSTSRLSVPLTKDRYPDVKRGDYANVNDKDLIVFEQLIPGRVLSGSSELDGYNTDWLKTCRGRSLRLYIL